MDPPAYETLTVKTLRELCHERRIHGCSYKRKQGLIDALAADDKAKLKQHLKQLEEQKQQLKRQEARDMTVHYQKKKIPSLSAFDYPFEYLDMLDRENTHLPGQPNENIGDFPKNIKKIIWAYEGENDEKPWRLFCKLTNNVYVFYIAWCDYTGFDCRGAMKAYASRKPGLLIKYGMGDDDYSDYLKDTKK